MKSIKQYILLLLFGALFGMSACTDSFENYNTDEGAFHDELQKYDFYKYGLNATIVQKGIYFNYNWGSGLNWPFQLMQNLSADMYAGYFHDFNKNFFKFNSCYNLNDGWVSSNWVYTYGYIMPAAVLSEKINENTEFTAYLGITKILKVETMHRIADQYGPLIYSDFGIKTGSDPESLKDAYYNFFSDLEAGINLIQSYMVKFPDIESFYRFDILTKTRTYDEWLRFANSLRLRLAMRISNVDKQKAEEQVKKCFNSGIGFLEAGTHLIAVSTTGSGYSNPLGEVNKGWGEVFMNANMESFLVGYDDPRISAFFDKAKGDGEGDYLFNIKGLYKGIRQGINVAHNNYNGNSRSTISQSSNAILMTPAEVYFLRAEAALRKLSGENPKVCYENGVAASLEQWGVGGSTADYLKSSKTPIDFKDPLDAKYDVKAMTNITPAWSESDTEEQKLERIITQKWIACYPEGAEAWAEQRRTGYPKLFKVHDNLSNEQISTDDMIRRIPYPGTLKKDNPEQYKKLLELLNGKDTGGTRLWWDAGKNNF